MHSSLTKRLIAIFGVMKRSLVSTMLDSDGQIDYIAFDSDSRKRVPRMTAPLVSASCSRLTKLSIIPLSQTRQT